MPLLLLLLLVAGLDDVVLALLPPGAAIPLDFPTFEQDGLL